MFALPPQTLFVLMWVVYLVYWWAMSRGVKEAERTEPPASRLTRTVMLLAALVLLAAPRFDVLGLGARFLPMRLWGVWFWSGAAITAGGLLFSAWARWRLGSNWSQAVTLKEGHELVTGGPYALVRHPIYTGLLLGFLGCAIAQGEWRGLLAFVLVLIPIWRKLRLEDQWLAAQFGDPYTSYARRVAALVPRLF